MGSGNRVWRRRAERAAGLRAGRVHSCGHRYGRGQTGHCQSLGASHTLHAGPGVDVAAEISELIPGGPENVFDSVGASATVAQALDAARAGGSAVVMGLHGVRQPIAIILRAGLPEQAAARLLLRPGAAPGGFAHAGGSFPCRAAACRSPHHQHSRWRMRLQRSRRSTADADGRAVILFP